ncbi:NfeD family protein [Planctomicrobium sp. SH661]|uniref:NfeD family protein n=1 Tax=Planctomicrobium sp. SH661 TaxID=3448124 RepID=UPI003F5BDF38
MDPQLLVLIFLLAGMALIVAELFVPSGGVIAVMCACCFLISGYYAYQAWYVNYPVYWWLYIGAVVIIIPATIIGAFQLLTRTPLGNRVLMEAPTLEEVTPYQAEQAHLESLIGQRGRALNLMTPGGMVLVNGERLHATGDGLMIEANSPIEVVAVRGTRVVVRQVAEERDTDLEPPEREASGKADPLDPWLSDDDRDA